MAYSEDELVSELLYGRSFLDRFAPQLSRLAGDDEFLALVQGIRDQAAGRFGGSISQEKRFASNQLYESGAPVRFAALGEIVNAVKADGYSMSSALITVYFAMLLVPVAPPSPGSGAASSGASGSGPLSEPDFRLRWPAEYRCEDGHYVRSKNEALVDNWLYSHGICHAYEKAVFDPETGDTLCSDFFVPSRGLYIEVWGMSSERYERRRAEKAALYGRAGCKLLGIDAGGVKNLDDVLSRELFRAGK